MSAGQATTIAPRVTDECLDGVTLVRESLEQRAYAVDIAAPSQYDSLADGLYVTGYKPAALDRCAFVDNAGGIAWIR
jgi:hypothetical protein